MLRRLRQRGPTERRGLLAAIHATAKDLGIPEDTRRDMQQNLTGHESCKDMSDAELKKMYGALLVIADGAGLRKIRRVYTLKRDQRGRSGRDERQPAELVTTEQIGLIEQLFDKLAIAGVGRARMNLCKRICGTYWPQTRAQANKVIEGLKAMDRRGWRANQVSGVRG